MKIIMIKRTNLLFGILLTFIVFWGCAHIPADKAGIGELPERPPIDETYDYRVNIEDNCSILSLSVPNIPTRIYFAFNLPDVEHIIGMQWHERSILKFYRRLLPGRKKLGVKGDYYWDDSNKIAEIYLDLPFIYLIRGYLETEIQMLTIKKDRRLVKLIKKISFNYKKIEYQDLNKNTREVMKREIERLDVERISWQLKNQLEQLRVFKINK